MKILAFDTSTTLCSTSVLLDGELFNKEIHAGQKHSELLLPMIHNILTESDIALTQLDCIAFGAGPGSFTGLRIACGVAQGLAFAANLPIVEVSTLEAIAKKTNARKLIVALDARMGEIYHAAYIRSNNRLETVSPPTLCQPHQAPSIDGDGWIGCGNGFNIFHEELFSRYHDSILDTRPDIQPHAIEIAQLAAIKFAEGSYTKPINASPIYIRNKVALKEKER